MEGLIDHIIASNAEVEREMERDLQKTEVPYLADAYKKWMLNIDGKTENVANAYVSYVKSADKELFLFEDDFFYLLPKKLNADDFDGVAALFEQYLAIIDEWLEDSKKEEIGISTKKISDWRSGFRNYRKFIVEWLITEMKKHLNQKEGKATVRVPECRRIFVEDDFRAWLVDSCNLSERSAGSYISCLKRVNRVISKRFSTSVKNPVDVFHDFIGKNLQIGKGNLVKEFLTKLIDLFNQKIEQKDETFMPLDSLRNSNAALRQYRKFILDEYIIDIPDEEEEQEIEAVNTPASDGIGGNDTEIVYDYEGVESNFQFRLFTQNRMSKNKDVFFPIGIIRQLFHKSEKESRVDGASNGNYKWLLEWARNCIAEIRIITDKGNTTIGKLNENNALIINPTTKDVTVNIIGNEGVASLMTYTDKKDDAPVLMKVDNLSDIHIDHSPLMCQILSDNISQLPALVCLTKIIRAVAEKNRIDITTKNFTKIGKKVINNAESFAEMEKLIPELKQELELIRKASTLQLMAAEYNLKKK